jgi:hypothetical protein
MANKTRTVVAAIALATSASPHASTANTDMISLRVDQTQAPVLPQMADRALNPQPANKEWDKNDLIGVVIGGTALAIALLEGRIAYNEHLKLKSRLKIRKEEN